MTTPPEKSLSIVRPAFKSCAAVVEADSTRKQAILRARFLDSAGEPIFPDLLLESEELRAGE